jgi:hypothetical protein
MQDQRIYGPGLCECGCGQKTKIAQKTRAECGWIKGEPLRYIHGHHGRKTDPRYVVEDRGHETPCWIWQLATLKHGCPVNRNRLMHRVYYEQLVGPIPLGLQLDHLCRNRACVNPAHLEPVTAAENQHRGSNAKLTSEDVREIRALLAAGQRQGEIGRVYGITKSQVSAINIGRAWRS